MAKQNSPNSPYLAARYEWNERYGDAIHAARSWRIVGLISLSMAVIGFAYALYQSNQVKLVPYIVEVDKLGTSVSGGFPEKLEYADERVIRAMLGSWVSNFRAVTPDQVVEKGYIDRVYALLRQSDPATQKINSHYRDNNPFEHAKDLTVSIEINNVIALSDQSYQIDWTEIDRARDGKELRTRRFRGIATVTLSPPQDEALIRLNPIGLYLKDFDWTAQL